MTSTERTICAGCHKPAPREWCWDGRASGCPSGVPPRYPPQPSITCPACGMTSYNPNDIREGYCGNCCAWTGPQAQLDKALTLGRLKTQWEKAIRQTFPDATDGQCVGLAVQLFLACDKAGVDLYVRPSQT